MSTRPRQHWVLAAALCGLPLLARSAPQVLVLTQEQEYLPSVQMVLHGINDELSAGESGALVYVEHLDLSRIVDPQLRREQLAWLERKYAGVHFDAIVTIGRDALAAVREQLPMARNTPVVFWEFSPTIDAPRANETAIVGTVDAARSLALIRKLLPDTRRVVFIRGEGRPDVLMGDAADTSGNARALQVEVVNGEPLADLERRVSGLQPGTVVLMTSMLRDRNGSTYTAPNVAAALVAHSAVPVFVTLNTSVGSGAMGGAVLDFNIAGQAMGKAVQQVLAGRPQAATGRVVNVLPHEMVDVQALQRFGVPVARVSADVTRVNDAGLLARYARYLPFAVMIALLQAVTILALLLVRRQRARAERSLAARGKFDGIIADASHDITRVPDTDVGGAVRAWLERIAEATAASGAALLQVDGATGRTSIQEGWSDPGAPPVAAVVFTLGQLEELAAGLVIMRRVPSSIVGVDDRELFVPVAAGGHMGDALYLRLPSHQDVEFPLARLRLLGELLANALVRAQNAAELRERVSDLEDSRREQRRLAGHLISTQENERRRVARELHDDITQRLSLLGLQLSTSVAGNESAAISAAAEKVSLLASDVSRLSHQLHPDLLHRIGLAAAVRGLCRDSSAAGKVSIESHTEPLPVEPSQAVALATYRVAQEALRNVLRHSEASRATVRLAEQGELIRLDIEDDGKGFDAADTCGGGLGLTSMRERAEILGGSLEIASTPGAGTLIRLRLPVLAQL